LNQTKLVKKNQKNIKKLEKLNITVRRSFIVGEKGGKLKM